MCIPDKLNSEQAVVGKWNMHLKGGHSFCPLHVLVFTKNVCWWQVFIRYYQTLIFLRSTPVSISTYFHLQALERECEKAETTNILVSNSWCRYSQLHELGSSTSTSHPKFIMCKMEIPLSTWVVVKMKTYNLYIPSKPVPEYSNKC